MDRTYLGAILRTCRVLRGIKQSDLAASIPVSAAALSHVESGRNLPSDRVLEAYANAVMDHEMVGDFMDLMSRIGPNEIGTIANMAHPDDPTEFMEEFQRSLEKTIEKPQSRDVVRPAPSSDWSHRQRFHDAPTHYFQNSSLRLNQVDAFRPMASQRPAFDSQMIFQMKSDESTTREALAEFIGEHHGQLLASKSKSYEFSTGVDISCDLIDIRHRIAFELKRLDRLTTKSIIEFVGKATIFRTEDFRFVVCLVSRPETEQQEKLVRMLRSNSVLVIWPSNLPGIIGYFDGDPVY